MAVPDPLLNVPTLGIICNVADSVTGELYERDARRVAQAAERYLKSTGIADVGGSQQEIDLRFNALTAMGDWQMW